MSTPDRVRAPHVPHEQPAETERWLSADEAIARLAQEDAVGQLRRRVGKMLHLGSDNGVPMLDWVDAVPRLLADPASLEVVESEAHRLVARGIRHVIWAGMGGSVLAVQVLCALGFYDDAIRVHPLDSTDPRALNRLLLHIADAKAITLPSSAARAGSEAEEQEHRAATLAQDALCHALLADVLMVAVAMGKTSEEPISHLDWFADLLRRGGLATAEHALVMAIPDSYLERYAQARGIPRVPLQLDSGAGTPGRMSAPATRVFLLPVAIHFAAHKAPPGALRSVLSQAWDTYDLDGAAERPYRHPFVRLAAALASIAASGACALWLDLPPDLDALRWWTEQLMEESLGKGGKGVVVFADQRLAVPPAAARGATRPLTGLHLHIIPRSAPNGTALPEVTQSGDRPDESTTADDFTLYQPLFASETPADRVAGLAALFLGLQLCMALYGYLHDIQFAGQPAVEQYKARARELRTSGDPIQTAVAATTALVSVPMRLLPPPRTAAVHAAMLPEGVVAAALAPPPSYLDLTINGELADRDTIAVEALLRRLGNDVLGVPVKLRRAPASYHSTEQSEMDGPARLVSLRAIAAESEPILLGSYNPTFLRAQAVGTWLAMNEQGRTCFLLLYNGTNDDLAAGLGRFLAALAEQIAAMANDGTT